LVTTKKLAH